MATKGTSFYVPVQKLSISQLQKDLLRTIAVTVTILVLLGGLYYWTKQGGWTVLAKIWQYGR